VAAGAFCRVPIVGWDFLPTFAEWAGVPRDRLPAGLEGGSFAGVLAAGDAGSVERPREELLFHFPHYQSGHTPHSAVRLGSLKLIEFHEDRSRKLFDLTRDPGERDDLAAARPEEARRLGAILAERLALVEAQLPVPNPDFREGAGGDGGADRGKRRRRGGRERDDSGGGAP
jgi:arylsulfatase A-like enzyme